MGTHLGMGVMIQNMMGNEKTVNAIKTSLGKVIKKVWLDEVSVGDCINYLRFELEDGSQLSLYDAGQSCCESRYMRTDDNLDEYAGDVLLDFELKDGTPSNEDDSYGEHEIQFLDVKTNNGVFQMANHNEHNGYYGGFSIQASLDK